MNTERKYIALVATALLWAGNASAQNAIKAQRQPTTFFYAQASVHGGYISDWKGTYWDLADRDPYPQLLLSVYKKSQRYLQKGYVRTLRLSEGKFRVSVFMQKQAGYGLVTTEYNLEPRDAWLKFDTKWDRTSIVIGYRGLRYGHDPKIDPEANFMSNMSAADLGFSRDLGIFFSSPMNEKMDAELSLTSGGLFSRPIFYCRNQLVSPSGQEEEYTPVLQADTFPWSGTWLLTGRFGTPTYRPSERGFMFMIGKVDELYNIADVSITRFGADWVLKHRERFKLMNQFSFGHAKPSTRDVSYSFHLQNNVDYYFSRHFIYSFSHSTHLLTRLQGSKDFLLTRLQGSLTWVASPHTRLRFNQFWVDDNIGKPPNWGFTLQLVTGIGRRDNG